MFLVEFQDAEINSNILTSNWKKGEKKKKKKGKHSTQVIYLRYNCAKKINKTKSLMQEINKK